MRKLEVQLSRFEPTYEELKHFHHSGFTYEFLGFEPTYEELKLKSVGKEPV